MSSTATVTFLGTIAAYVGWDEKRNIGVFEYEDDFLKQGIGLSPLHMPVNQSQQNVLLYSFPHLNKKVFSGLPGLLSDSLPDLFGNKVIDLCRKDNNVCVYKFQCVFKIILVQLNNLISNRKLNLQTILRARTTK